MNRYKLYKENAIDDMPVYLSEITALRLREGGDGFTDFLDESIKSFAENKESGKLTFKDDEGNDVSVEGFDRASCVYDHARYTLEKFYDRCVFFTSREIDARSQMEHEQEEIRDIYERDFDELYDKAMKIAEKAHAGQVDKSGVPYIKHPIYVSEHVSGKPEKIAALLHDVVEDSDMTLDDLYDFPSVIIKAVDCLTRKEKQNYTDYICFLRLDPIARNVKIADMKHNMDISRLKKVTVVDRQRVMKYEKYLKMLQEDYVNDELVWGFPSGESIRMIDYQWDGYLFHTAVECANQADREHLNKALETVNILNQMSADNDTKVAALLYCTVPMESDNIAGVRRVFGENIFEKYAYMPWNFDIALNEKVKLIHRFFKHHASDGRELIMLAVTIAELRALEKKVYEHGKDGVFDSFDEKLRNEDYYNVLADSFEEPDRDDPMADHYWTLQNLFKDVFVKYYISTDIDEVYQGCELFNYVFRRDTGDWEEVKPCRLPESSYKEITREEAESITDDWIDELMNKEQPGQENEFDEDLSDDEENISPKFS